MRLPLAIAVAGVMVACTADGPARLPPAPGVDYATLRERLDAKRIAIARELPVDHARAIRRGRDVLVTTLRDELLPAWNGTAWAMNGTSQTPRSGAIACGYFISTTLRHAGLRVERARLGQQASEYITRSLVTTESIWQTSDQPIDAFLARLRRGGPGIYLVGLDNHVGFVIVDGRDTWFHHAGPRAGVQREPARTASFLSTSRYRQAAKLFDDTLVEKWLRVEPIATVSPRPR